MPGESLEDEAHSAEQMAAFLQRASGPTQRHAYRRGPRITSLETAIPHDVMPGLLILRVHTDAGSSDEGLSIVGHGETYYIPTAAAAAIHDFFAPRLIGADVLAIESHWRFLYERMTAFGGTGAELRALSAGEHGNRYYDEYTGGCAGRIGASCPL